jgi:hypothetical protein
VSLYGGSALFCGEEGREKGSFPPRLTSFTFYSRRGGDGADMSPWAQASYRQRRGAAAALAHRGAGEFYACSHLGESDTWASTLV